MRIIIAVVVYRLCEASRTISPFQEHHADCRRSEKRCRDVLKAATPPTVSGHDLTRLMKFTASLLLIFVLTACGEEPPPSAPPPPEVQVVTVELQPIENTLEMPGRLEAVRTAEVRARVDGIVQRRLYQEGTDVRAGQPLFAIDPRELRARLSSAQASLARAEATAANAARDVQRYEGLVAKQAISQQEYDSAEARLRTAQADVAQARAQAEAVRLSLSYTTVTAPISGRAGRAQCDRGSSGECGSGNAAHPHRAGRSDLRELLAVELERFAASQGDRLGLSGDADIGEDGRSTRSRGRKCLPPSGELNFVDLRLDEATGTAALRAEFPNPDRSLLPGQFVRVRVEAGVRAGGISVPQRAVSVTPGGATGDGGGAG
jgi:membrane fusion protein, multidrug efflux system